jgi:IPT/TIG domain
LNSIKVCGQVCDPSFSDSTSSNVKCKLSALPTTYSIESYTIIDEQYLMGTPFSSIAALTMSLWDGSNQNGWTSSAKNCYFGTAFRAGYVGVINEVKYFMSRFIRPRFVGQLKFQGSQDGSTWTDIFTVGEEIHEGWNYHNYPAGQELKYRFYRFFGLGYYSCMVGEVSLRGYEVIDNVDSSYTCQAQIFINGSLAKNLTGSITYQDALTPLLTSISPRFGSVVGGENVTFTGENFSSNVGDYSILIDNRVCTVLSANSTQIVCLTGKRPGLYATPTLEIYINGMGRVATQGMTFRYVNYWSEPLTWGGEFAPIEGDLVYIP